jgi:DNA polymerase V
MRTDYTPIGDACRFTWWTIVHYDAGMAVNRDREYLGRLQEYYAEQRVIPSLARLGALVGMRSKEGAAKLLARLRRQGYLARSPEGHLLPTRRFFERPLVGKAPAGFASPATELLGDAISIDDFLVEHPASTVLVKVVGDSMIGAGIHGGDFLVVERRANPAPGSIVVAIVDGEFTIKYLQKDRDGYFLQPANPSFPNIRPRGELQVFGIMVGMFRKA